MNSSKKSTIPMGAIIMGVLLLFGVIVAITVGTSESTISATSDSTLVTTRVDDLEEPSRSSTSEEPPLEEYDLESIVNEYNNAIVIIFHLYYYAIDYEGERVYLGLDNNNEMDIDSDKNNLTPIASTGTGFFVSTDGKLITNRHVAFPWKDDEDTKQLIESQAPGANFEGETVFMSVAVNGTQYTGIRSTLNFDECEPIKFHDNEEVDIALLQMKNRRLPNGINYINIRNRILMNSESTPQGAKVFSIGFPGGFDYAVADYTVNSSTYEGSVQQEPGDYIVKCNMPSAAGASGSPVFNEKGQVIGILTLGFGTNLGNYIGCMHAKFIMGLL